MAEEFDGETPDQKRAAEKRKAAAETPGGGDATDRSAPAEAKPAPKSTRKA